MCYKVSYSATSPLLSDPTYNHFARTILSDSYQTEAMLSLIKHLGFYHVNLITANDEFSNGGNVAFNSRASEVGVQVVTNKVFASNSVNVKKEVQGELNITYAHSVWLTSLDFIS